MTPSQTKEKNSKSPLNKGGLEKPTKFTLLFHFLGTLAKKDDSGRKNLVASGKILI